MGWEWDLQGPEEDRTQKKRNMGLVLVKFLISYKLQKIALWKLFSTKANLDLKTLKSPLPEACICSASACTCICLC